jgi:predicted nuclease with RNAse H fold
VTGAAGNEQEALFEARDAGLALPPLPACDEVVAGVDVGGMRKGLHAVALARGQVLATYASTAPRAIAEWCVTMQACAVGVDAPSRWSVTGRSRAAERELRAAGIQAFATPTLAVATAKPFYRWMLNGADLYLALARHYALYEGGEPAARICLETYPQAVACALATRVLRARDKRANRRAVLSQAGIDIRRLTNIDYLDAALCAVAACYARAGHYRAYGNGGEGRIYVPGRRAITHRAA